MQEVRYVHSSLNIADALTKSTKTGVMLLQLVQTGQYDLPGGTFIRDSTMSSVRTWNELMQVEQQEGRSQEEVDKTDLRVFFTSVQAQSSTSNPPRGTSSSSQVPFSSLQSLQPGSNSVTRSLRTKSTSTPSTGTLPRRKQPETRTTLSLNAEARSEGSTKPL